MWERCRDDLLACGIRSLLKAPLCFFYAFFTRLSGGWYDQVSKKQFDELVRTAKFEGYYDDARAEFDALKARLDHHDTSHDLDLHRDEIQQLLEQDIVSAYYYQVGQIIAALRSDKATREAMRILSTDGEYEKVVKHEQTVQKVE